MPVQISMKTEFFLVFFPTMLLTSQRRKDDLTFPIKLIKIQGKKVYNKGKPYVRKTNTRKNKHENLSEGLLQN